MALLIDSTVFIALERQDRRIVELASSAGDEPVALAAITASELLAGVLRADTPERRLRRGAFVEAILDVVPIVAFDLRIARVHAQIWTQLMAAGQGIGSHDLLIAATALAHDNSILTENVREFGRVAGLTVRRPDW